MGRRPRGAARRPRIALLAAIPLLALLALTVPAAPGAPGTAQAAAAPTAPAPASTPAANPLTEFYSQDLDWRACAVSDGQCARLTVPVDYARPDGPTIRLLVQRMPATGQRVGALVINPGGPGIPAAEWAVYGAYALPPSVNARYDIVAFDPRGVGASSPLRCFTPRTLRRYVALDPTPTTPGARRALADQGRDLVRGCRNLSPGLWRHVGTRDVARDLDVLRAVLGESRLTYLGFSYGTAIGAAYADLFPHRVGRMALDGGIDPSLSALAFSRQQARGFDHAMGRFIEWCVRRGDCPLGDTVRRATAELNALVDLIERSGLSAPGRADDARLTTAALVAGLAASTYSPTAGWPRLRVALSRALRGDGGDLLSIGESLMFIGGDIETALRVQSALAAVTCTDTGRGPTYAVAERAARRDAAQFRVPVLAYWGATASLACSAWPTSYQPRAVRGPADRPILVIGTRHDSATPYAWSVRLADQLRSARLLTVNADGHLSVLSNLCARRATVAYLLRGELPEAGVSCRTG